MDVPHITTGLKNDDGIWYKIDKPKEFIFYPEVGSYNCFQVEEKSFWFNHRNKCIAALIDYFSPDDTLIDIGGGNGYQSAEILKLGIDVILLEPSIEAVYRAKERGVKKIICAPFDEVHFLPGSCHAACIFDVLEHIKDDVAFLQNIRNILKQGGYLYITVPTYKWLWSGDDVYAKHFRRYTIRDVIKKLKLCGFRTVFSSYLFSFLPLPIFITKTISSIFLRKEYMYQELYIDRKSIIKEHIQGGFINAGIIKFCNWEVDRLKKRKSISFGSSCILVAQKV